MGRVEHARAAVEDALSKLDRAFSSLGKAQIVACAGSVAVLIGYLDYLASYELSLSVMMLIPVVAASWYGGRRAGIGVVLMSCICLLAANAFGPVRVDSLTPLWNALVRLCLFAPASFGMAALREALLRERRLARTDALTGVCSRHAFEERFEHDLNLSRRRGTPLTLAYVDLDEFKQVNDRHGHAEGDRALRAVGQAMLQAIRSTDTAARLGGDEFALVLPDTDREGAERVIGALKQELNRMLAELPQVTVSIGAVVFRSLPARIDEALHVADSMMYEAKRRGRNLSLIKVVGQVENEPRLRPVARPARRRSF